MLNLWKREDLVHNGDVKIVEATAEGLVDFAHEVFTYWNHREEMELHETKGRELSYVI